MFCSLQLAAVLTIRSVTTNIRTVYDLRARAVATQDVYQQLLKIQYFVNSAANYTLNSEQERLEAFEEVLAGNLAACVLPHPLAQHVFGKLLFPVNILSYQRRCVELFIDSKL